MPDEPVLYGAPSSVYVRAVRLVLEEKGIPYRLVPIDVFAEGGPPVDYLARHPFGRIPAFAYQGFGLYEAGAISRYIDESFSGPSLQPGSAEDRARVNQILGILDSYVYRTMVWDIYVERVSGPKRGRPTDEAVIAAALPRAAICLSALEEIMGDGPFLAGSVLTLADLHAAPMFAYFTQTAEAGALLAGRSRLPGWWGGMARRPSMIATDVG